MKKHTVFAICCLMLLLAASFVHAQQGGGFTGPQLFGQPPGFTGHNVGFTEHQGFMGPSAPVTVAHVVQTFPNKAQAVLRGNIVQQIGSDRYLFRDSTGEVLIKIKNNRWWGLSVGPNDLVEVGGELKRDKKTMLIKYFDAKSIRSAF